ncbi:MAG: hypothetical protein H6719_04975 [Sandaracinaceae bacterium]|nr:hypothetical protein [Sandaracinaceae bacterium]
MRALTPIALLVCAWPLAAQAQSDEAPPVDEFEDAEVALGSPRPVDTWTLDDGVGADEVPWDTFDPSYDYFPRGPLQVGLEARISALPTTSLATSPRPQLELHGFLNFRYSARSPWQMRVGVAIAWEPHESTNLGGGTFVTTSALYVRLRVLPLSVDFGRNFGLRAGPDVGFQYAPSPGGGAILFAAGGTAQIVARTDDGRFEAGVHAGAQLTGIDRLERPNPYDYYDQAGGASFNVDPIVGATAGYLF